MANKVYNLNGGLYSGDAFTAFETRIASSNNGSIVASPSDLKVSAGSGMNVTVSTGAGIIGNGTLSGVRFAIDAPVTVAISAASTANPRMDSVVAYIDKSVSASTSVVDNTDLGIVKFKSVAGTPASAPTAPSTSTIQSSIGAGNPYMVLANITVPKSSTAASSFKITDTRVTPTSAIITDNSITTRKLANKSVTSDKVDWTTIGKSSSRYIKLGDIAIQWGVADFGNQSFSTDFWTTFNRAANQSMYFNYPIAFDEKPVLMMNLVDSTGALLGICYTANNGSGSRSPNFTVYSPKGFTATVNVKVQWIAIGAKA